jgi:predicted aminopeptidase
MVPAFERLLAEDGGNLGKFYARVRELAAADRSVRDTLLAQRP